VPAAVRYSAGKTVVLGHAGPIQILDDDRLKPSIISAVSLFAASFATRSLDSRN
jgi:hypothetical protein